MTLPADEGAGRLARELVAPLAEAYQERYTTSRWFGNLGLIHAASQWFAAVLR